MLIIVINCCHRVMNIYGLIILFCLLLYMFEIFCNKKLKEMAEKRAWALVLILSLPVFKLEQISSLPGLQFPYQQNQSIEMTSFQFLTSSVVLYPLFNLEAILK